MISLKRSAPVACRYFYCHRSGGKICGIWRFFCCTDEIGRNHSWRFSKLWISRGFGAVVVLVGEQKGLRGKIWWDDERSLMRWKFDGIFGISEVWFYGLWGHVWDEFERKLRGCEIMILILHTSKAINKKRYNLVLVLVSIWYEKRWFYGLICSRCMKILHKKTIENTGRIKVFSSPRQKRSTLLI